MIKNIIFDWGGVLIHLDKNRCAEAFAECGIKVGDELSNPYGQRTYLKDFERGLMSVDEFHETVRRVYGAPLADEQIDYAWNALLQEIPTYGATTIYQRKTLKKRNFCTNAFSSN